MFIIRRTRAGKAYALSNSCEPLDVGNLKSFFNFTPDNCVRCEADFAGHNSIFCGTLSDVRC